MGSFKGIRTYGLYVSANLRSGVPSSIFSPCLSIEFRVSPPQKRKERLIAGYVGAAGLDSDEKVFDI